MRRLSEKNVRQRKMWSYVVLFVLSWSIVRFIQLIRHEHYFFEQWWVHFPLYNSYNSYRTPNSVEYFLTVYCNQFWFPTKYIWKVLIPILFYDNLPTKSYMTCLLLSAWTADKHSSPTERVVSDHKPLCTGLRRSTWESINYVSRMGFGES